MNITGTVRFHTIPSPLYLTEDSYDKGYGSEERDVDLVENITTPAIWRNWKLIRTIMYPPRQASVWEIPT